MKSADVDTIKQAQIAKYRQLVKRKHGDRFTDTEIEICVAGFSDGVDSTWDVIVAAGFPVED